jgi:hypothetical protein
MISFYALPLSREKSKISDSHSTITAIGWKFRTYSKNANPPVRMARRATGLKSLK